jgi:signal transduction histidine kinase
MRRLYLQIYLTFLGIIVLLALSGAAAWLLAAEDDGGIVDILTGLAEQLLPGPDAPVSELERSVQELSLRYDVSLALFRRDGRRVAAAGDELPRPDPEWNESRVIRSRGRGLTVALRLSDGRFLVVRHRRLRHALGVLAGIGFVVAAVGLGSYPLVRRLTRRLERLQARVDALGAGKLDARVEVEGRDEVAKLASSFNRAASRIERLVESQRTLLAGASHELRSPLTRIRVAVALLGERAPLELRDRIDEDIRELDELIGELILASRLEATEAIREPSETVDLLALAAEEADRYQAGVSGAPLEIRGERGLLRHLLRNLLENARRHAEGATVEVEVLAGSSASGARLRVMDRGPGVPPEERERVFEPFYQIRGPSPSSRSRHERGVGLGLALVRKIARLHGGEARCLSREGGGTVIEVELPGREGERKDIGRQGP